MLVFIADEMLLFCLANFNFDHGLKERLIVCLSSGCGC